MLFTISFSYSQDWKLLSESKNEITFYKPNTEKTVWVKIASDKTEYYPNNTSQKAVIVDGYRIVLFKFDCTTKKMGIIQSITYSNKGKILETFEKDDELIEMNYVTPDSNGETLFKVCCK